MNLARPRILIKTTFLKHFALEVWVSILTTFLKTLTPLLEFLLVILACISLSKKPIQAADQLNLGLAKIHRWADKWLVTFNSGKSGYILLSRKYNKPFHPLILINQTQIAEVNSHKHIGVIFSND